MSKAHGNRHLPEWRFLLFTIIVTVKSPIWNVIRIVSPPFGDVTNRLPFVQRLTAFYQVLHILSMLHESALAHSKQKTGIAF